MSLANVIVVAVAQAPGQMPVVEPLQPLPAGTTPAYKENLRSGDFATPAEGSNPATPATIDDAVPATESRAVGTAATSGVAVADPGASGLSWGVWAWVVAALLVAVVAGFIWKRSLKK